MQLNQKGKYIIPYEIAVGATHFPLLKKHFYYVLVLHSGQEMSKTFLLTDIFHSGIHIFPIFIYFFFLSNKYIRKSKIGLR